MIRNEKNLAGRESEESGTSILKNGKRQGRMELLKSQTWNWKYSNPAYSSPNSRKVSINPVKNANFRRCRTVRSGERVCRAERGERKINCLGGERKWRRRRRQGGGGERRERYSDKDGWRGKSRDEDERVLINWLITLIGGVFWNFLMGVWDGNRVIKWLKREMKVMGNRIGNSEASELHDFIERIEEKLRAKGEIFVKEFKNFPWFLNCFLKFKFFLNIEKKIM